MSRERLVAIVVHDVAPATWPACRTLLSMIDALGAPPVTLLVVPHFHRGMHAGRDQAFIEALDSRVARGDELALHGLHHSDDAPPPRMLRAFAQRRLLTRSEGEFAAIGETEALDRLQQGIAFFAARRWPLQGFVPPAWLINDNTRRAIDACGHPFGYVPVRGGIYRLPQWQLEPTANYCYSPDSRWRRGWSRLHTRWEASRHGDRRLLRLSLHPLDAAFPTVVAHWRTLIVSALRDRRAVTKRAAMADAVAVPRYADKLTALGGKLSGT